jgi:hypothetical protein
VDYGPEEVYAEGEALMTNEMTCGHTDLFVHDFRGGQSIRPCLWCRIHSLEEENERLQNRCAEFSANLTIAERQVTEARTENERLRAQLAVFEQDAADADDRTPDEPLSAPSAAGSVTTEDSSARESSGPATGGAVCTCHYFINERGWSQVDVNTNCPVHPPNSRAYTFDMNRCAEKSEACVHCGERHAVGPCKDAVIP